MRAAHMEQTPGLQVKTEPINAVTADTPKSKTDTPRGKPRDKVCRWCGNLLPHPAGCPARGKTCRACGKLNHFAKVCRSTPKMPTTKKAVRAVTASPTTASDSDMDNDQQVVHVIHTVSNQRLPMCQVVLHHQRV
ncbi:hypothetical protein NDU88_000810 [Pleurodeles waltl]|uniref:CCHC-type domain-containing protein n=1 Tax=Pleurodeles waltl TaxID=8319 RepID=A0AAV7VXN9_PLEWA|nr:hypothetical protein NDU88_000810 [Pleurodeles waltl]